MKRDKSYTEELRKTAVHTKLTGVNRQLAQLLTLIELENETFTIIDQPGCEKLQIKKSTRGLGGFNLNYPRTVEIRFSNGDVRVIFGLSGFQYECSEEEVRFVRKVMHTYSDIEKAIFSEEEPTEKDIGSILSIKGGKLSALPLTPTETAKIIAKVGKATNQSTQYLTLRLSELLQS